MALPKYKSGISSAIADRVKMAQRFSAGIQKEKESKSVKTDDRSLISIVSSGNSVARDRGLWSIGSRLTHAKALGYFHPVHFADDKARQLGLFLGQAKRIHRSLKPQITC